VIPSLPLSLPPGAIATAVATDPAMTNLYVASLDTPDARNPLE